MKKTCRDHWMSENPANVIDGDYLVINDIHWTMRISISGIVKADCKTFDGFWKAVKQFISDEQMNRLIQCFDAWAIVNADDKTVVKRCSRQRAIIQKWLAA